MNMKAIAFAGLICGWAVGGCQSSPAAPKEEVVEVDPFAPSKKDSTTIQLITTSDLIKTGSIFAQKISGEGSLELPTVELLRFHADKTFIRKISVTKNQFFIIEQTTFPDSAREMLSETGLWLIEDGKVLATDSHLTYLRRDGSSSFIHTEHGEKTLTIWADSSAQNNKIASYSSGSGTSYFEVMPRFTYESMID